MTKEERRRENITNTWFLIAFLGIAIPNWHCWKHLNNIWESLIIYLSLQKRKLLTNTIVEDLKEKHTEDMITIIWRKNKMNKVNNICRVYLNFSFILWYRGSLATNIILPIICSDQQKLNFHNYGHLYLYFKLSYKM